MIYAKYFSTPSSTLRGTAAPTEYSYLTRYATPTTSSPEQTFSPNVLLSLQTARKPNHSSSCSCTVRCNSYMCTFAFAFSSALPFPHIAFISTKRYPPHPTGCYTGNYFSKNRFTVFQAEHHSTAKCIYLPLPLTL